jgi:hypothetical protein
MPCPNGVSRLKSRSLFVSHPGNLHSVEILSDQTAIAEAAHACRRAELAGAGITVAGGQREANTARTST